MKLPLCDSLRTLESIKKNTHAKKKKEKRKNPLMFSETVKIPLTNGLFEKLN